jgi:hypothetical protein
MSNEANAIPDPPVMDEPGEVSLADQADRAAQAAADLDRIDVLMVKHLPCVLEELRLMDSSNEMSMRDPSVRVLHARDMAYIALCERLGRVARRDLPADQA